MANEIFGNTIASTYKKLLFTKNDEGVQAAGSETYIMTDQGDSSPTQSALSLSTGRVGIGTASPSYPLEVNSGAAACWISTDTTADGHDSGILIRQNGGTKGTVGYDDGNDNVVLVHDTGSASTKGINITSTGKVGIGTASPSTLLQITGSANPIEAYIETTGSNADAFLKFKNDVTTWRAGVVGSDSDSFYIYDVTNTKYPFKIEADGTNNSIYLKANGNVGIGTTSPDAKLQIFDLTVDRAAYKFTESSTSGYTTIFNMDDTGLDIGHSSDSRALNLKTDSADRLTILAGGNVGIGTTSPAANLEIESSGALYSGTPTLLVQDTSNRGTIILESTTDQETDFIFKNNSRYSWGISSRDSAGNYNLKFYASANGSSFVMEGDWDTDTGVFAADFNDTSDVGLKENIVNLSNGITKVLALKPRTFDWKRSAKGSNTGFIAQEVETVLPNDVSGEDWTEENPDIWKSINTQGIVAVCVKAIQELSAKVTALENK